MAPSPSEPAPRPPRIRTGFLVGALVVALPVLILGLRELAFPGVAVLCLHGFGDEPADPWTLPAARLGDLLDLVAASGREVVDLDVLLGDTPRRAFAAAPVLLTFDDARASHGDLVPGALRARGWPAVFFAQSSPAVRELDDAALRSLARDPLEVGCHSRTHARFVPRGGEGAAAFEERLRPEVVGAREELEERLGAPVRAFAYPSGDAPEVARALAAEAGYRVAFTTEYGHARIGSPRPLASPRMLVDRHTPDAKVREYLSGPRRDTWVQVVVGACVALAAVLGLARRRAVTPPAQAGRAPTG